MARKHSTSQHPKKKRTTNFQYFYFLFFSCLYCLFFSIKQTEVACHFVHTTGGNGSKAFFLRSPSGCLHFNKAYQNEKKTIKINKTKQNKQNGIVNLFVFVSCLLNVNCASTSPTRIMHRICQSSFLICFVLRTRTCENALYRL